MLRINQLKLRSELVHSAKTQGEEELKKLLASKASAALQVSQADILELDICRESIDARKKPDIFYIYTIEVRIRQESKQLKKILSPARKKGGNVQISEAETVKFRFPKPGEKTLEAPVVMVPKISSSAARPPVSVAILLKASSRVISRRSSSSTCMV